MPANTGPDPAPALPSQACLPINRCNLPCHVLAGLTFQDHPQALQLDGVADLHRQLFAALDAEANPVQRAALFVRHMKACFQLENPASVGFDVHNRYPGRIKTDYLHLLRGWLFNADGLEAAVIKAWVESRFGLQTRKHHQSMANRDDPAYARYQADQARALYNSNALHAQLDVLYGYCQYELLWNSGGHAHRTLYRGVNRLDEFEILAAPDKHRRIVLLNNINSFSSSRERADEFGDRVISARVPLSKVLFAPGVIPGLLQGEEEHLVIGGLYRIHLEGL